MRQTRASRLEGSRMHPSGTRQKWALLSNLRGARRPGSTSVQTWRQGSVSAVARLSYSLSPKSSTTLEVLNVKVQLYWLLPLSLQLRSLSVGPSCAHSELPPRSPLDGPCPVVSPRG